MSARSQVSGDTLALAGGLAGIIEAVAIQPLEIIKVRFQLNEGLNTSISNCCRDLIREGGVPRLYRGLLPELLGMFPTRSVMYTSQELCRRQLIQLSPSQRETSLVAGGAGILAAVPEAAVTTPFQFVKLRLQSAAYNGRYTGTVDCVQKVATEEGIRSFGTGFTSTAARNSVWNGVYFFTMFHIRHYVKKPESYTLGLLQTLAVGFFGGVTATSFNAPLDVVKSRIQGQISSAGCKKYTSILGTLTSIISNEGVFALYKGFQPKALRMGLGGGVALTSFEMMCALL